MFNTDFLFYFHASNNSTRLYRGERTITGPDNRPLAAQGIVKASSYGIATYSVEDANWYQRASSDTSLYYETDMTVSRTPRLHVMLD